MTIEEILQVDHISRLLKGKYVEEGKVLASGFTYRRNQNGEPIEKELSFNWLEFFDREGSIQENISMIRKVFEKKFGSICVSGASMNRTQIDRILWIFLKKF